MLSIVRYHESRYVGILDMFARLIMSVYLIPLKFCLKILKLLSPRLGRLSEPSWPGSI